MAYRPVGRVRGVTDASLLHELEPVAAKLLDRHLATSREWFPHELVPYGRGRDYVVDGSWSPSDADLGPSADHDAGLDEALRSALFVNLLTEDNLPYYFRDIERMFGKEGAFGTWVKRWTAEEGRHSMVLYGYITTCRLLDPKMLERGRMAQVSSGRTPSPPSACDGFAYVAMQELATRIAHRNTGRLLGDPVGYEVMMRVATDENLHHLMYRDLASAAFELDPSAMMVAVDTQVREFAMPGVGIPEFGEHAKRIAKAGIYDLAMHHDQILVPVVLRHWGIEARTGLSDEAERARDRLLAHIAKSERVARRLAERRGETVGV